MFHSLAVRVIAGALKGRRLITPRGHLTRPTADQVRIALMDTLMPYLPDSNVLDLFAGAGGVGIEALSRGAARVTFVERDRRAAHALRQNLEALDLLAMARVLVMDVERALPRLFAAGEAFDIVFLDPPYETALVPETLDWLGPGRLTRPGSLVVAQHFTKRAPALAPLPALTRIRARRFGETTLTFFRAGG
jgi:16S rRNA (guanine(966)-N(2))-methyltransferase RsmD